MTALPWNPEFASGSPMFEPLRDAAKPFARFSHRWPTLADYQAALENWPQSIVSGTGQPIKAVAQDARPDHFSAHYAPRIHFAGELQTRSKNWHDFFQLLTWFMFPETKALIYALTVPHARQRLENPVARRRGHRSPLENMLALFDEGGAVVVASDETLLQLIDAFQWKTLFLQRRDELKDKLQCIIFGHALYEKALTPYVGMTANSVLMKVDETYFSASWQQRLAFLDTRLASLLAEGTRYRRPKDLSPFPLLGMPDWDPANAQEAYYDNTRYFRPGRNTDVRQRGV